MAFANLTFIHPNGILTGLTRGGAEVARRAHNPKVAGSNPVPATKKDVDRFDRRLFGDVAQVVRAKAS